MEHSPKHTLTTKQKAQRWQLMLKVLQHAHEKKQHLEQMHLDEVNKRELEKVELFIKAVQEPHPMSYDELLAEMNRRIRDGHQAEPQWPAQEGRIG